MKLINLLHHYKNQLLIHWRAWHRHRGPNPPQYKNPKIQNKLQELTNHIYETLPLLHTTSIGNKKLIELPWFLLLGPSGAGKTALLAHSHINFILKKVPATVGCSWWCSRDFTFLDVPGQYLNIQSGIKSPSIYPVIWDFFLRTLKKQGKKKLAGTLLTLPIAEMIKQNDVKKNQTILLALRERLAELKKIFPQPMPCYLIITKCDLLPGFKEFFAESTDDETSKTWGISVIPTEFSANISKKIYDLLGEKFNELIKKINQQLLWRLHQERNPMAKPYIKDFPLQVERLKEFTLDCLKQLDNENFIQSLHGIYLTSALQIEDASQQKIPNAPIDFCERQVQIFKAETRTSRPYFIKQIIAQALKLKRPFTLYPKKTWSIPLACTAAVFFIAMITLLLVKDFNKSMSEVTEIKNSFAEYQSKINELADPDQRLFNAINLISRLQKTTRYNSKFDLLHLFSFYSNRSQQKAAMIYQTSLQQILLPQIKIYLGEYLKNPVNKNIDSVYTALTAYLMLADTAHFQAGFISNIIEETMPKTISREERQMWNQYINMALKQWSPLLLDKELIQQTRDFLIATPGFQLSYIILKNMSGNDVKNKVNLGQHLADIFVSENNDVPTMFTAKNFTTIFEQEINTAAHETITGNWVLGNFNVAYDAKISADLVEQLRETYINNYREAWENYLANLHLIKAKDLAEVDSMIATLTGDRSPLLQLLQIVYENTYFEPIISASPKLQKLSLLLIKNHSSSNNQLYEIFTGLQLLHHHLQTILQAENARKAAFLLVSQRLHDPKSVDAITQLRLIADKSPEPIKFWIDKLTDDVWHFLFQEASFYMDTSQNPLTLAGGAKQ